MLVYEDGTPLTSQLLTSLIEDKVLQRRNESFLSSIDPVPKSAWTCCLVQGERALIDTSKHNSRQIVIGSIEATTCVCVVLLCSTTDKAWAAHYDEGTARSDTSLQELCASGCFPDPVDTFLLGAFPEGTGASDRVCRSVLNMLHTQCAATVFRVKLACLGAANHNPATNGPWTRDLAVNCTTGQAFSGGFADRGPEIPRRSAICNIGGTRNLLPVWDTEQDMLVLPVCPHRQLWLWGQILPDIQRTLQLTDADLLRDCSTSPAHESPDFCSDQRKQFAWLQAAVGGLVQTVTLTFNWGDESNGQQPGWFQVSPVSII